ncbi:hypothetical protein QBC47DRAFT_399608 [Echria macrotheca]|uniref:CFEM domain-containing protein n=1 Tax=Echria macrotheca TaxID=438768 RepID=A0AAJ0BIR2_9PEZI|nr:hypothetical protein QBC47DRAFT_399608 [Echria macrotheca]
MKLTSLLIAAASSSLVLAQNLAGQPPCATSCLASAISAVGCAATDISCQCGASKTAIAATVAPCLIAACQASDLGKAQSAGEAACSAYSATATATATGGGVTLTSNTTVTGGVTIVPSSTVTVGNGTVTMTGMTSTGGGKGTSSSKVVLSTSTKGPASSSTGGPGNSNGAAGMGMNGLGGLVVAVLGVVAAL